MVLNQVNLFTSYSDNILNAINPNLFATRVQLNHIYSILQ